MKLLGNSLHSITPLQKQLLYRCCILPIALYRFQLWFYNHALLSYPLKALGKMKRRAAIWILGVFKTSPTEGIEAIIGLLPIKLHLQKLAGRSQLCTTSLLMNHIIRTLMDSSFGSPYNQYPSSLDSFTKQQRANIKGHFVNSNNRLYRLFPSIFTIKKKITNFTSINLTQWLLSYLYRNL